MSKLFDPPRHPGTVLPLPILTMDSAILVSPHRCRSARQDALDCGWKHLLHGCRPPRAAWRHPDRESHENLDRALASRESPSLAYKPIVRVLPSPLQNMPAPNEDHFLPLHFEMRSKSRRPLNLLDQMPYVPMQVSKEMQVNDIFAWLNWSPPIGSQCANTLHRCFPGALPGHAVLQRSSDVLQRYGLTPENTIYGQSICPDEINLSLIHI